MMIKERKRTIFEYCMLFAGVLFFWVYPVTGMPAEIHVPTQYGTIQSAIDAAGDGDTIIVAPGTYTENINFGGKGVIVTGSNPLDPSVVARTIIQSAEDCEENNCSVVTFSSGEIPDAVLTGFTIRNGKGTLIDDKRYGGGIYCTNQSNPTIRFNRITSNTADYGAGIYVLGDSLPVITAGPNASYPYAAKGGMVTLTVTATDPDGDTLTYNWTPRDGGNIVGTGNTVSFYSNTAGVKHIDLTVDDGHGGTANGTVTVTVIDVTIGALPPLVVGQTATLSANVTPSIAGTTQYPVSITWSLTGGTVTGVFDTTVNGTVQATSITFTPSAGGLGTVKTEYKVGETSVSASAPMALNPSATGIDVGSANQDTTVQVVITGQNLGRVIGANLGSGITAMVGAGKTETSLPMQLAVSKNAMAGERTIVLNTPEGSFATALKFTILALPAITATPATLNLTTGGSAAITFSLPSPAPSGGVNLSLSSSAITVATIGSSLTIPSGQQSAQANVAAVGYGTATVSADAVGYSKAQVTVNVTNQPLMAFNPVLLNVVKDLTQTATVNISNPAPTGGLAVTLSEAASILQISPATFSISAGSVVSPVITVKGLAIGTTSIKATTTGYPDATLPVTVQDTVPNGCGQTVAGTIDAAGQKNSYTLTATAGDKIAIRARKTGGTSSFNPFLELYNPSGTLLTNGYQIDTTATATGTYTVIVRDYYNTTGTYLLFWNRLNSPCNVASSADTCGQPVTGSIGTTTDTPPWRTHTMTIPVSEKVRIYLDGTSGSLGEIYNSSGASVGNVGGSGTGSRTADFNLTAGTYTMLVRDYYNGNTSGTYTLAWESLLTPCSGLPTALACGQTLSGTIGATDEMDQYTISATAGDKIAIRARKTGGTSSFNPFLELYNPSGTLLTNGYQIDTTATATGTYTVIVRDYYNTNTGTYLLFWNRLNSPCNVASSADTCGQPVTGSIGTTTDTPPWRTHTMTIPVSEKVRIYLDGTSGSLGEIYNSSGASVGNVGGSGTGSRTADFNLTAGTYTMLVRDYYNGNTSGTYTLAWESLLTPCSGLPTALACGQTLSGTIGATDEMDQYTISATAGDKIAIRARKTGGTSSFNPFLELYNPSGTLLTNGYQIDTTATATGTYTVIVRDYYNTTGTYLLFWNRLNSPCNVASSADTCGQPVTGSIGTTTDTPPWRTHTMTIPVSEKVRIYLDGTSGSLGEIYNSSGASVGNVGGSGTGSRTADFNLTAGTYTMLVRDYYNGNTSGTYTLAWESLLTPCSGLPTALACGQTLSGTIGATDEMDQYTISATAGDKIAIRARKTGGTSSFNPFLELYNPSGTLLTNGYQIDTTATATGTYTVIVRDYYNTNTGTYLLFWNRLNSPCNVASSADTCGQPVTGSIGTTTDTPPWRTHTMTIPVSEKVRIYLDGTSGSLGEIYNSSGASVGNVGGSGTGSRTADFNLTAGTYTMLVRDYYNGNTSGTYTLAWESLLTPCSGLPTALACGQTLSGTIGATDEMDQYTISATAGDVVTITTTKVSGTVTLWVELYSPSGVLITSGSVSGKTLTETGTYTVVVRDVSNTNAGDYNISWQKSGGCP